jgi:hypothetical protein
MIVILFENFASTIPRKRRKKTPSMRGAASRDDAISAQPTHAARVFSDALRITSADKNRARDLMQHARHRMTSAALRESARAGVASGANMPRCNNRGAMRMDDCTVARPCMSDRNRVAAGRDRAASWFCTVLSPAM